ncbi:hypothetical protein J2D69_06875 [Lysinibacillus sphaericus]|nr:MULTISPECIES: hypothetical protein [Lysinibacillus]MBE5083787.1 hypothetical protein [Bacillus thuringiensis]AMO34307.1 hypothetical protein AR327_18675 [Lysinibacillus sphaericus]AMR90581.1 hypothetical protein A1T07_10535 [Lysinibacillus sphaericus]ANA44631.1 hypothetical protein A2J09_03205 [Lysinibacillus sphaericus]EWH34172.1 hypothetical protein P799_05305 [Lysinibacillus sphaericus CBAM5]
MENLQTEESVEMVAEVVEAPVEQTEEQAVDYDAIQDQAKQLEIEKQQLKEDTLKFRLEQEGLGFAKDFATTYSPTENIEKQIEMIQQLIAEIKLDMGFKPKEVAKQDDYTAHKQNGDAKGMIASKFAKLFK